jgi:hypothetical protein
MKKSYLIIMIVFLSACSAATPEPMPALTPTNTVTPLPTISEPETAKTSKPTASPELSAYVTKVYRILDDLSHTSEEMDQLFTIAKARNNFTNEAWLERANKTFDALMDGADQIEAIEPVPAQAESAHEDFLMAAEELRLVVSAQQDFIDGEIGGEESANEYMKLHLAYVQKGLSELNKYQP